MNSCSTTANHPDSHSHAHDHDHAHSCTHDHTQGPDKFLWACSLIILTALTAYGLSRITGIDVPYLDTLGHSIVELLSVMWWGVVLGLFFVGLMGKIPKEYFTALLGRGDRVGGIFRAAAAGVLLDLCSHGILMVAAKLYERGASIGQIMTFLIASPWNSFSLTLILVAMIGLKWTLVFIAGSMVIAIITGLLCLILVRTGILPDNPHTTPMPDGFRLIEDAKTRLKGFRPDKTFWQSVFSDGWRDGKMVLRWLAFGVIIAALIRSFIPIDLFATWFAPTMGGLLLTLLATTLIEVCSEGSSPIGADLVTRAAAPGNGFAFLMAGASTDYTEIMVLRNMASSWKIALSLPFLTVPQVLFLGWIMNGFGATLP